MYKGKELFRSLLSSWRGSHRSVPTPGKETRIGVTIPAGTVELGYVIPFDGEYWFEHGSYYSSNHSLRSNHHLEFSVSNNSIQLKRGEVIKIAKDSDVNAWKTTKSISLTVCVRKYTGEI